MAGESFRWEDILEDAKAIGLNINSKNEGNFIESATVCAELILRGHGKTCETYKTAAIFTNSLELLGEETEEDELKSEFLRALLEDFRLLLNANVEYDQSEEAISDTMEANEYEFTIDGRIF